MDITDTDPMRIELEKRWERVIAGRSEVRAAVLWAEEAMGSFGWRDEITFQGLSLLHDLWDYPHPALDDEGRKKCAASYRSWRREVARFEADPTGWNRNYALEFVRGLPLE
jgi:hypothetical protein